MMSFLKSFLSNDKSPEELALERAQKPRDILMVGGNDDAAEDKQAACEDETPATFGGCCGGGCRR